MSNNAGSSGRPPIKEIIANEFSSKQSWYEFKQSFERSRHLMPIFTKSLLAVRFLMYWVSWFTDAPNSFMVPDADLMYNKL